MYIPTEARAPGIFPCFLKLRVEMFFGFFLSHSQHKSIPDVAEVINRVQFGYACLKHHGQQVNEQGRPPPENKISIFTQPNKPESEGLKFNRTKIIIPSWGLGIACSLVFKALDCRSKGPQVPTPDICLSSGHTRPTSKIEHKVSFVSFGGNNGSKSVCVFLLVSQWQQWCMCSY